MYLPGPACTQILADFGAEVIKIEDTVGELGRWGPPLVNKTSARYYAVNRHKQSLSINLKTDAGQAIFKQLVTTADIVIEQFRPGTMEKLGLGYEELKKINPELIYCSLTGYGYSGPMKMTAGHDINYLSMAGISELSGDSEKPSLSAIQIADLAGGTLHAVIAVLLALIYRNRTGKGQFCDVAMFDGSVALLGYLLAEYWGQGFAPKRGEGVFNGGYACYGYYRTKDGRYVSLGAIEQKFWEGFCNKVGMREYINDNLHPHKQPEIKDKLTNLFLQKTQQEWMDFLAGSDLCFTPVLTLEEMCEHPQVKNRHMVIKVDHFDGSERDMLVPGVAIKLSESPGMAQLDFAGLGQHTQEILSSLGFSLEAIEELRQSKVIK